MARTGPHNRRFGFWTPMPATSVWRTVLAVLLGALLAAPPALQAQPRYTFDATATVLPKTVVPTRVQAWLDVDPARDDFGGRVAIQLQVREAVPAIVLHASQLQAGSARLTRSGAAARTLLVEPGNTPTTWRLVPADGRAIAAGRHVLDIAYRGRVQASGEGLFRVDYRERGQPARMLATQLQAVQARAVMPLFDEPAFRVPFELSVRAPAGYDVVSNMPRRSVRHDGTARLHAFASTPPMPSYLLSLAVGRFDVLAGRVDGVPLRILTARGKGAQAAYAMQVTQQVLPFFRQYFGRPFALPKLDQLAVPATRQGAMEDWGLISYIEDALLFDPDRSSPDTERGIFGTVAHEVAHQWFGNLVSVASWNETWLNEAFATWMEQKASAHFHPEWQTALRVRRNLERTAERDATSATRAIRSGPVSESSVFEVFDGITYDKGGAVLTMLEQWIGPAAFRRGLAAYMAERAMKPATAGDLWHHIGRAAGQPVAEVAASWTDQPGLPLLSVSSRCDAGQTLVQLRQERYSSGEPLEGGPWLLPLRLARGDATQAVLMRGATQELRWPGCDDRPLLANAGGLGYYRVDADPALRQRLAESFTTLSPGDRVALVSDSFALARAGRRPLAEHFKLLAGIPGVKDSSRAALFMMALDQWRELDAALDGTPSQAALRAAGQTLFAPELQRLGWSPAPAEDRETQSLRAGLIIRLATLGHRPTVEAARQRFAAALAADARAVHPSIRGEILAAVGTDPQAAEFDALLAALHASDSQEERWQLIDALAAGRDEPRARRLLAQALTGQLPPDLSSFLASQVARRPPLAPVAYDFVLAHWDALSRLAGDGVFGGRNWLLPGAVGMSADTALVQRMLADQQRLTGDAGRSSARQVAAAVDVRRRLRERESGTLATALAGWAPMH